jgi:hypothetical protein
MGLNFTGSDVQFMRLEWATRPTPIITVQVYTYLYSWFMLQAMAVQFYKQDASNKKTLAAQIDYNR